MTPFPVPEGWGRLQKMNRGTFLLAAVRQPAAEGVRQKEFGKKVPNKSDRSIRKTERVPKTKKKWSKSFKVLPTSFCGTLVRDWHMPPNECMEFDFATWRRPPPNAVPLGFTAWKQCLLKLKSSVLPMEDLHTYICFKGWDSLALPHPVLPFLVFVEKGKENHPPKKDFYPTKLRESFCESGEGVRLPRERADLRGSPGTSGEVRGTSGEVRETSGEPLDCCEVPQWENFRGSGRKTSGEVRGTSGEVRGLPRSSG